MKGRPAVYLQSFEEKSVRRLATLLPAVPRTLLVGGKDAARWLTADGLREVKTFATAIGPARQLIEARPAIVADAHAAGLAVVPYTFRQAPGVGRRRARGGARRHAPLPRRLPRRRAVHRQPGSVPALTAAAPSPVMRVLPLTA